MGVQKDRTLRITQYQHQERQEQLRTDAVLTIADDSARAGSKKEQRLHVPPRAGAIMRWKFHKDMQNSIKLPGFLGQLELLGWYLFGTHGRNVLFASKNCEQNILHEISRFRAGFEAGNGFSKRVDPDSVTHPNSDSK